MASSARTNARSHSAFESGHGEDRLAEACRELNWDFVLLRVSELLRKAQTGKEAIHGMLQSAVSLGTIYSRFRNDGSTVSPTAGGPRIPDHAIKDLRRTLERQVRERFEASVSEGELPENANVESMSALCMSLLSGLLFCMEDGVSETSLLDSVGIFVEGLGFHTLRPLKRRSQTPVLALVRK
jgi:hypothetical protein